MNGHSCPQCLKVFKFSSVDPLWKLALAGSVSLLGAHALKSPWGLLLGLGVAYVAHEVLVDVVKDCPECRVALQVASAVIS
jgi:hypothetical protein